MTQVPGSRDFLWGNMHLEIYLKFVTQGAKAAGFTDGDLAAACGVERLKGRLHDNAAYELMEENNCLDLIAARLKVVKFVEECVKKDPNNNYDYSPHH